MVIWCCCFVACGQAAPHRVYDRENNIPHGGQEVTERCAKLPKCPSKSCPQQITSHFSDPPPEGPQPHITTPLRNHVFSLWNREADLSCKPDRVRVTHSYFLQVKCWGRRWDAQCMFEAHRTISGVCWSSSCPLFEKDLFVFTSICQALRSGITWASPGFSSTFPRGVLGWPGSTCILGLKLRSACRYYMGFIGWAISPGQES